MVQRSSVRYIHIAPAPGNVQPVTVAKIVIAEGSVSSLSLAALKTQQLTATPYDFFGHALPATGMQWSSSNTGVATVGLTGLVTAIAIGSCTLTATLSGVIATLLVTVTQAQDASYADVIATATADSGSELLRFFSARVATTDGVGAQTVPQVPGMPGTNALTCIQNGGGNTQRPSFDNVNKIVRTNAGGPTAIVSSWNGDLDLSLSRGLTLFFIGAVNSVGAGTACMGMQRPSALAENFQLMGSFFGSYLDAFLNTPSGHQYNWSTFYANNSSALKILVLRIPPAGGDDGDLNAMPWATSEIMGVEGPRGLPHGQVSANQYTKYANDSYRLFFGSPPSGTVGSPSLSASVDLLFGDLLVFAGDPSDAVYDAVMRYFLARPGTVAPVSNIDGMLEVWGDSRPRGNGAPDLAHALPGQIQTVLGSRWQVENRGIAGDNLDNIILQPYLSQRLGHFYHSSRPYHQIHIWCYINSAKDSTHYASPGMDAATALARVTTLVNRIRLKYPDKSKVKIAVYHETGDVSGAAAAAIVTFRAGLDSMKATGFIEDAVVIEAGTDVLDFVDGNDYTDGLHPHGEPASPPIVNVVGEVAAIAAARALALAA